MPHFHGRSCLKLTNQIIPQCEFACSRPNSWLAGWIKLGKQNGQKNHSPLPGGLRGRSKGGGDWQVILFPSTIAGWAGKAPKAQDRDSSFDSSGNGSTVKETCEKRGRQKHRIYFSIERCQAAAGNTKQKLCQVFVFGFVFPVKSQIFFSTLTASMVARKCKLFRYSVCVVKLPHSVGRV